MSASFGIPSGDLGGRGRKRNPRGGGGGLVRPGRLESAKDLPNRGDYFFSFGIGQGANSLGNRIIRCQNFAGNRKAWADAQGVVVDKVVVRYFYSLRQPLIATGDSTHDAVRARELRHNDCRAPACRALISVGKGDRDNGPYCKCAHASASSWPPQTSSREGVEAFMQNRVNSRDFISRTIGCSCCVSFSHRSSKP